MLRIISNSLKTGILTEANPFGRQASFGFPVMDFSRCTACGECARSCPTSAIQTMMPDAGWTTLSLSYASCIQCRECVAGCPEQAISVSTDIEVASYSREQLARSASFEIDPSTGRATLRKVDVDAAPSLAE
jgi:formate hydrogenlyase subunit 6/NADH:ubiquinone oxidoreductase subunit I